MRKVNLFDTDTYRKVLVHRGKCPNYPDYNNPGKFCIECFGGGLHKFTEDLNNELKAKDWQLKEDLA